MKMRTAWASDRGTTTTDTIIPLGVASIETKGAGAYPQPDSNQPTRQAFGIQGD